MPAKRFNSLEAVALRAARHLAAIIALLSITLIGGGCATASSQAAKSHKPQMITSDGVEVVGGFNPPTAFENGFNLSDKWAAVLTKVGEIFGLH